MREFGCACWYALAKQKLKKLHSWSRAAIFIGYSEQIKAYKRLDLELCKFVVSRDEIFDERVFLKFVTKFSLNVEFDADDTDTEDPIEICNDNDFEGTEVHDNSNGTADDLETKDVDGTEIQSEIVNDDGDDTSNENDHSDKEKPSKNKAGINDIIEVIFSDAPRCSGRVRRAPGSRWSKALLSVNLDLRVLINHDVGLSDDGAMNCPDHAF